MKNNLERVLTELYSIDPELQSNEAEIKKIVLTMLENKPEIKIDRKFVKNLRKEIELKTSDDEAKNLTQYAWFKNIAFAVGGAMLCLIIVLPLIKVQNGTIETELGNEVFSSIKISRLGDMAFGSLNSQEISLGDQTDGRGAGGAMTSNDLAIAPTVNVLESDEAVTKALIYRPKRYVYNYVGGDFELEGSQVEVLRKDKNDNYSSRLAQALSGFELADIDLKKFSQLKLRSLDLYEDRDYGYSIYADLENGTFNIRSNYDRWPQNDLIGVCEAGGDCSVKNGIPAGSVPEESVLIELANDFLAQKNISTEIYAEPIVDYDYEMAMARSSFAPQNVSVIYPLKISDKIVYGSWGDAYGLNVSVNIYENKVSGVSNIEIHDYQSSTYPAVTDMSTILEYARTNGQDDYYNIDADLELVEVEIGNPEEVYVKSWNYNSDVRKSEELIIPAIKFEIINKPVDYYGKDSVIVPLVEDLINEPVLYRSMPEPMFDEGAVEDVDIEIDPDEENI